MNIKAYAKINFVLNVLGVRPDGYHEVENVMQALDFYDEVSVTAEPSSAFEIRLSCENNKVPSGEDNLAYKAACLMHDTFRNGINDVIRIGIIKRIPIAAGLAGGSADAAAVLYGLAKAWGIDPETVYPIAAKLGSDVPFCYANQLGIYAAYATGTGTEFVPIAPTDCKVLLAPSEEGLSTAAVYAALGGAAPAPFNAGAFRWNAPLRVKAAAMGNHLEVPALSLKPELAQTLEILRNTDSPVHVGISGSGPTCFAVYHKTSEFTAPEGMLLLDTLK